MKTCYLLLAIFNCAWGYNIIKDYSGDTFFDDWDFYGSWDNLTLGAFFIFLYFYSTLNLPDIIARRCMVAQ